jgi:hypothetical protein
MKIGQPVMKGHLPLGEIVRRALIIGADLTVVCIVIQQLAEVTAIAMTSISALVSVGMLANIALAILR